MAISEARFATALLNWYKGKPDSVENFFNWFEFDLLSDSQIQSFLDLAEINKNNANQLEKSYAFLAIGVVYQHKKNRAALQAYEDALYHQNPYANYLMGELYVSGLCGVTKDLEKAQQQFAFGVKKDNPDAMVSHGRLCENDIEQKIIYYNSAIKLGSVRGMLALAEFCNLSSAQHMKWQSHDGKTQLTPFEKAVELYSMALKKKSAMAGINLGNLHVREANHNLALTAYLAAYQCDLPLGRKKELYEAIIPAVLKLCGNSGNKSAMISFLDESVPNDANEEDENNLILLFLPYKEVIFQHLETIKFTTTGALLRQAALREDDDGKPDGRMAKLMAANVKLSNIMGKPIFWMTTDTTKKIERLTTAPQKK